MSFLNTTATITQSTPLPASVSRSAAIALLQNHAFIITLDPEYVSHVPRLPAYPSGHSPKSKEHSFDGSVSRSATDHLTKNYTITDHMDALTNHLFEGTVTFEAALTPIEKGTHWLIHGPLGLLQESVWTIEGEEGGLELVEVATIRCSRLLIGTVKKKVLGGSAAAHRGFVEGLMGRANTI